MKCFLFFVGFDLFYYRLFLTLSFFSSTGVTIGKIIDDSGTSSKIILQILSFDISESAPMPIHFRPFCSAKSERISITLHLLKGFDAAAFTDLPQDWNC